jgi:hypothetical protein
MDRLLADLVLVLHAAIVAFVVGGLAAVWLGRWRRWAWVDRIAFRAAHLAAIVYVAGQQWLGVACPLTTLESWLRMRAGEDGYSAGFVADWLQAALFYEAPPAIFTATYTLFALAVLATWWWLPPRRTR